MLGESLGNQFMPTCSCQLPEKLQSWLSQTGVKTLCTTHLDLT